MGPGEEVPTRSSKPATSPQNSQVALTAPSYPDWSSSMQAFYGAGATSSFFSSTVTSPTPRTYMWGSQQNLMPPYGTPVPYPALYPPGGAYSHPNMPMTPGTLQGNTELNGKVTAGTECVSNKNNKGPSRNYGLISGKSRDGGKATSGSGNDAGTRSVESGSEDPSDTSDNNNNNKEFPAKKRGSFKQLLADVSVPATNLNIGMGLWNASPADSRAAKMCHNPLGVSPTVIPSGMTNDQWTRYERELKRQKRKQSNRESARRSRLRKQAECEELQHRVETLTNENHTLRDELGRLSEECEKLTAENSSIKEELTSFCGPEALSILENSNSVARLQTRGDEANC